MRSSADAWTMQPTTVEAVSVAIAFSNVKPYGHHTNLKIHCQVYIAKLRSNISCAPAAFIRLLTVLTNFIRIYANNTLSYDNQANGHEGCCRNIFTNVVWKHILLIGAREGPKFALCSHIRYQYETISKVSYSLK